MGSNPTRLATALAEMPPRLIVRADQYILESFAVAVVEMRRCQAVYAQSPIPGLVRARGDGRRADAIVVHPIMRPLRFWSEQVRVLARDLGLSPSARSSMHLPGEGGVSDSIEATIAPAPRFRFRAMAGGAGSDELSWRLPQSGSRSSTSSAGPSTGSLRACE